MLLLPSAAALRKCLGSLGVAVLAGLSLSACANQPLFPEMSATALGAADGQAPNQRKGAVRVASAPLVAKAQADLKNTSAVIAAARALRSEGDRNAALALVEKAMQVAPKNANLMREAGLLSLELGRVAKAETVLKRAIDGGKPDWQTHSALGSALASNGKQSEAQIQFAKALALAPDQPSVLNNLALSYALDGKPAQAERVLRLAAQGKAIAPQVRQNLALVLSTRGKLSEAERLTTAAAGPETASSNAAYLRSLAERANGREPADVPLKSAAVAKADTSKPYLLGARDIR